MEAGGAERVSGAVGAGSAAGAAATGAATAGSASAGSAAAGSAVAGSATTSCAAVSGAVGPPTAASSVNHSPSRANGTYPAMRRRFASGTRSDSTGAPTPAAAGAPVAAAAAAATSGTTRFAASVGVEARRSATSSRIGRSASCPIAETIGVLAAAAVRTSPSSLKPSRFWKSPPPRATMITSTSGSATSSS